MEKVLEDLGCHDKELSILFTDDRCISKLNDHFLHKKSPTNVLAFPMSGGPSPQFDSGMLGDVVISIDTARRESEALDEPLECTLDRLLIHGVLHLLGHDHEQSSSQALHMRKEEERLMGLIKEG
jgi:rRNA maturation RNase YbeY